MQLNLVVLNLIECHLSLGGVSPGNRNFMPFSSYFKKKKSYLHYYQTDSLVKMHKKVNRYLYNVRKIGKSLPKRKKTIDFRILGVYNSRRRYAKGPRSLILESEAFPDV